MDGQPDDSGDGGGSGSSDEHRVSDAGASGSPTDRLGEPTAESSRPARDTAAANGEAEPTDPVREALAEQEDLQNIATWEVRSRLDRFAVRVAGTLRRVRSALLITVGLVLFVGQILGAGLLVAEEPLLGLLAVVSALPALGLAAYVWYGDPTPSEPVELLVVTFLLAIVFASLAAVVNSALLPVFQLLGVLGLPVFFFFVVGPVEETVKWLAIRTHAYGKDTFDTVVDGAVYGAAAGLGFAAIENLIYIVSIFATTAPAGDLAQQQYAIATAATRAFVGPGHVVFSAWAGFYLGLAKFNPENRGPIVVKGLLIAAFIHALYNTLVSTVATTMLGLVAFALVYHSFWFALLYRKISRYRTFYARTTAGTASSDAG